AAVSGCWTASIPACPAPATGSQLSMAIRCSGYQQGQLEGLTGMPDRGFASSSNGKAIVKSEPLECVVGNCNYRVNNKYDGTRQVYPVPEIIVRANNKVGKTWTYHDFAKNCEHFANEIRYNKARSDQVCNGPGVRYCSLGHVTASRSCFR
uniref:LRAT domain-containing protein n=1 Tax=Gopherus agassizii TaxID=38772 RepID=A0A452GHE3_9SAUR